MNKKPELIERIRFLITELDCTQNEFASRIGSDPSNLSKHMKGKLPINESLINRIVINLGVSKEWLLNGTDIPFGKKPSNIIAIEPTQNTPIVGTPVYDIDVTAGNDCRSMMFADDRIIGAISVPNISVDSRIVRVSGDSMAPVICNGDYLAVRELSNISQLFWGQIYVVILEDYRMVKYVRRHEDPEKIILRSENKNYDDMEVNRCDIRDMLFVQNILHIDSRM